MGKPDSDHRQVFRSVAAAAPELEYLEGGDLVDSRGAIMSKDGRYRYLLWRVWNEPRGLCAFVMLNPSTADHQEPDATVKRCMRFAMRWSHGGIVVVNLFALRATHPQELTRGIYEPEGEHNRNVITRTLSAPFVRRIVVAWGDTGALENRAYAFLDVHAEKEFWCIRDPRKPAILTKSGFPRHPVRLSLASRPERVWWDSRVGALVLEAPQSVEAGS